MVARLSGVTFFEEKDKFIVDRKPRKSKGKTVFLFLTRLILLDKYVALRAPLTQSRSQV